MMATHDYVGPGFDVVAADWPCSVCGVGRNDDLHRCEEHKYTNGLPAVRCSLRFHHEGDHHFAVPSTSFTHVEQEPQHMPTAEEGLRQAQEHAQAVLGDYERRVQGDQQTLFDIEALPDKTRQRVIDLKAWLDALEERIGTETLRKAVQYGSADLAVMGEAMVLLFPKEHRSEQAGLQMAIAFYLLGKVARIFGAFEQGHLPTGDDWFDAHVYGKMGLKVHETGRWL